MPRQINTGLIFEAMHLATQALLASHATWAEERIGAFSLEVKLGRGRRTYLRHARGLSARSKHTKLGALKRLLPPPQSAAHEFQLVYGRLCLEDMFNEDQYWRWKSYQELYKYGYLTETAGADCSSLSPLQHLCHIVLHEFSHFIQAVLGQRYDGSVHNHAFYQILQRSYDDAEHKSVLQYIIRHCQSCPETSAALQQSYPSRQHLSDEPTHNFNRGQTIGFTYRGQCYQGTIARLNKQRATILLDANSRAPFAKALIPYAQLHVIEETPAI